MRVYCAIGGFGTGGMTRAVLARASLLSRAGHDVTVLTLKPLAGFRDLCAKLVDDGLVDPGVHLVNPYEHFADIYRDRTGYVSVIQRPPGSDTTSRFGLRSAPAPEPPVRYIRRGTTGNRYRELGLDAADKPVVRVVRRLDDAQVIRVDYLDDRRETYRSERFAEGAPDLVTDLVEGTRVTERYLSPSGFCYVQLDYDPQTEQVRTAEFQDPGSRRTARFSTMEDLIRRFAVRLIGDSDEPAVLICDDIGTPEYFRQLNSDRLKVVPVVHENHLTSTGEVLPHLAQVLDHVGDFPAVVCPTRRAAADISAATGASNVRAIPNYIPAVDSPVDGRGPERSTRDVALVSRLVQGKCVDDALRAFALVADRVPDARLLVYGRGEELESLQVLATELGIDTRVAWEGHTSTAVEDLAQARVSIMTSESEGFGMVIVESMAVGTPVVAMDCNYGPRDLIVDGVTGYVVEDRDIDVFADRVCALLTDDVLRQEMSEAGLAWVSEHLSAERIAQQWDELFDALFPELSRD